MIYRVYKREGTLGKAVFRQRSLKTIFEQGMKDGSLEGKQLTPSLCVPAQNQDERKAIQKGKPEMGVS